MDNEIKRQNQIDDLNHTIAKRLYNLALFTLGDQKLAEQVTVRAFSDAYNRIPDKSDSDLFIKHCYSLLYLQGKKVQHLSEYGLTNRLADNRLTEMLFRLDFHERYILLLFCLQKQSIRQITKIMHLPRFMIEKRLNAAVNNAMR